MRKKYFIFGNMITIKSNIFIIKNFHRILIICLTIFLVNQRAIIIIPFGRLKEIFFTDTIFFINKSNLSKIVYIMI